MSGPRRLLIKRNYGAPTPVWISETTVMGDIARLGLRRHLADSLHLWQAHFEAHVAHPAWRAGSEDSRRCYVEQGEAFVTGSIAPSSTAT